MRLKTIEKKKNTLDAIKPYREVERSRVVRSPECHQLHLPAIHLQHLRIDQHHHPRLLTSRMAMRITCCPTVAPITFVPYCA